MYSTSANLVAAGLVRELAQLATPESSPVVSDELMRATLLGADRSSFDPDLVAVADQALVVIEQAATDAAGVINGYLQLRKPRPYTLPLDPVPPLVKVWARSIQRYLLNKNRTGTEEKSDPVVRDYRDALRFLQLVQDGKFSLGAEDPLPPASGGAPEISAGEREFSMSTLRDFGAP